jgi:hypothetical protein
MRNLSCAVNVRRRGRSKSSGDAAAGAETIVGLPPSSLSAPAAARVLLSLIWGITTGWLSYAPKGKLLAGVCLIIIGTEGRLLLTAQQVCFPCLLSDNQNHDFTSHCINQEKRTASKMQ